MASRVLQVDIDDQVRRREKKSRSRGTCAMCGKRRRLRDDVCGECHEWFYSVYYSDDRVYYDDDEV